MWSPRTKPAMVSNIGTSTRWPRPVRSRCTRPARMRRPREADDAVGQRVGHIARCRRRSAPSARAARSRPGSGRHRRARRIGAVLPEAERADIEQARVDPRPRRSRAQPLHRLRPDVVDQHVGRRDQAQQPSRPPASSGRATLRLLRLVCRKTGPIGTAGRPDLAHDVACGRLDLDHVGADVAEHWVAYGPISTVVMSMILMPCSGPMVSVRSRRCAL